MTGPPAAPADPLAPLRAALLERARADAEATLAQADEAAGATLAAARSEAEVILSEARQRGAEEAAVVAAAERARASRASRQVVMAARRMALEELRARSRAAVAELAGDDSHPLLLAALRDRVLAELGPDATIEERDGGVVGVAPGRRVRYALEDLADRAVDSLGDEVERLWSS